MTKALKIYVITGCILQLLVFRTLELAAIQIRLWFESHGEQPDLLISIASLYMHPFLYAFTFAMALFVAYAIIRKKSDRVLVHTLGILLLSSLGVVVFQGFGIAMHFTGMIIGHIN